MIKSFRDFINEDEIERESSLTEKVNLYDGTIWYKGNVTQMSNVFDTDKATIEKEFKFYFNQDSKNGSHIGAFFNVLNRALKVKENFSPEHMIINIKYKRVYFISDSTKLSFCIEW